MPKIDYLTHFLSKIVYYDVLCMTGLKVTALNEFYHSIEHIPSEIIDSPEQHRLTNKNSARGMTMDTINALHLFSFPALRLVGHQMECMNIIQSLLISSV